MFVFRFLLTPPSRGPWEFCRERLDKAKAPPRYQFKPSEIHGSGGFVCSSGANQGQMPRSMATPVTREIART
jgi:hypothetical protein